MLGKRGYISRVAVALFIPILFFGAILGFGQPVSTSAGGVNTQLCFILDGSSSILDDDWTIMVNGLADAVANPDCFPHDGSVELTVILFGWHPDWHAEVAVSPLVITSTNAGTVAATIRGMAQPKGATPMACGIFLAADMLFLSPNFNPSVKQAINLVTDGEPNICCAGYEGYSCGPVDPLPPAAKDSAEEARGYLISKLSMTPSQDEFDAEFIGIAGAASDWLRDYIVWPQPGYIAPPFNGGGWVRVVANATVFAETVC